MTIHYSIIKYNLELFGITKQRLNNCGNIKSEI